nr:Hpt domain-containing protein [uncultured Psychroserpens sp.]
MEQNYKLNRVKELADNDMDFIKALAEAFIEEVPEDAERLKNAVATSDYKETYQAAHKMKPTIDLFELGVLQDLLVVQDWGKFEKAGEDCSSQLKLVLAAVEQTTAELKEDFNL